MQKILKKEMNTFKNLPVIIESYISKINENDLDVKRNKDSWTIREHVYHLVDVQKMLLGRLKILKNMQDPIIEPYFPENENDLSHKYKNMEEAFKKYKKLRKEQIKFIKKCKKDDLNKNAIHKEYKKYSIPIILNHMIFHEYWHMYRIEEIWLTKEEYFK